MSIPLSTSSSEESNIQYIESSKYCYVHAQFTALRAVTECREGLDQTEVTGVWRKSHDKQLLNLYASTNIVRARKSKQRGVLHLGDMRNS
jgi:hypothetical protein